MSAEREERSLTRRACVCASVRLCVCVHVCMCARACECTGSWAAGRRGCWVHVAVRGCTWLRCVVHTGVCSVNIVLNRWGPPPPPPPPPPHAHGLSAGAYHTAVDPPLNSPIASPIPHCIPYPFTALSSMSHQSSTWSGRRCCRGAARTRCGRLSLAASSSSA